LPDGLLEHLAGPGVLVLRRQQVTEGSGGEACSQGVACLPVQRQALFQQRPCLRLVPASDECEAGGA
jgi:hypothetical protein